MHYTTWMMIGFGIVGAVMLWVALSAKDDWKQANRTEDTRKNEEQG